MFESFVNSERCKTAVICEIAGSGLRALLIQKDVKPGIFPLSEHLGLRALLIQKDVKQTCNQKRKNQV